MNRARGRPRRRKRASRSAAHIPHNRAVWDRVSPWYERHCARVLSGRLAASWGMLRVPESRLRLLSPPRGQAILELGCGAARWSGALARRGARPVGIDLSSVQLARARELQARRRVRVPLVRGNAERLPFRAGVFDLVFCDFGAMTFADPVRTVPECARVLRTGGRFVFATSSPLRFLAFDFRKYRRQTRRLIRSYFEDRRIDMGPRSATEFQLSYGGWIELFRKHGFAVERLVETQVRPGQRSAYLSRADAEWGESWPLEAIWSLVKE